MRFRSTIQLHERVHPELISALKDTPERARCSTICFLAEEALQFRKLRAMTPIDSNTEGSQSIQGVIHDGSTDQTSAGPTASTTANPEAEDDYSHVEDASIFSDWSPS
jgi:hypothetical protein